MSQATLLSDMVICGSRLSLLTERGRELRAEQQDLKERLAATIKEHEGVTREVDQLKQELMAVAMAFANNEAQS